MRLVALLLILSAFVFAGEEALLHAFKIAREDPFSPRGRARMGRAIEAVSKGGGVRCVAALADFLRVAEEAETKVRKDRIEVERSGRVAHSGMAQVKRELEHLRHRESAGAIGLGPQISARVDKLQSMEAALETAKHETRRYSLTQAEIFRAREASVVACAAILARLKPDDVTTAIGSLRKSLDVDSHAQVLLLVRVLRSSKRKEAGSALLEVFSHPKTGAAGRTAAGCAIAFVGDPNATRQLIKRLRQDAASDKSLDRSRIMHEIGLAARQRFEDLDAAAKWAATLK